MSTEIVILVIGAILLLVAVFDSIKFKDSYPGLINIKVKIPMGIIGILLLIYGGYSFGLVNPQPQIEQAVKGNKLEIEYPVTTVQIVSPLEGDSVDCRILTMGVYPESCEKDIWVLLKPSDGKYYPQSDHTNTSYKRNGEWQVITRFGGDKGEKYEIIVFETEPAASEFFSSTIQNWKDAQSYPGLEEEELPDGANELDRISVYLKDNCRGVF